MNVYMIYKNFKLLRRNKECKLEAFTTSSKIAQTYININSDKNLFIEEIQMRFTDYCIFYYNNNLKEIKCYRLEDGYGLIIMNKKDKLKLRKLGVHFYDIIK